MFKKIQTGLFNQRKNLSTKNYTLKLPHFLEQAHKEVAFKQEIPKEINIKKSPVQFYNDVAEYVFNKISLKFTLSQIETLCTNSDALLKEAPRQVTQAKKLLKEATDLADNFLIENVPPSLDKKECEIISKSYSKYADILYKTQGIADISPVNQLVNKALELNPTNEIAQALKLDLDYELGPYPKAPST